MSVEKMTQAERIQALEARLGVTLALPELGLQALTHKSYVNEHKEVRLLDNERLEFLGDAVVDLAISDRLMGRFPHATEGELSKLRALIVNEDGLARIARRLQLGELLLLGRGEELTGGRDKNSVLADALEAVIGAVYRGSGLGAVLEMVDRHFADALEGVAQGRSGLDYKTKLQEDVQTRMKVAPRYRVVSEAGPDHEKTFEVEVSIGSELYARATGKSKKEAEQAAARATLEMLQKGDTGA
jgi:ribonuclease-3